MICWRRPKVRGRRAEGGSTDFKKYSPTDVRNALELFGFLERENTMKRRDDGSSGETGDELNKTAPGDSVQKADERKKDQGQTCRRSSADNENNSENAESGNTSNESGQSSDTPSHLQEDSQMEDGQDDSIQLKVSRFRRNSNNQIYLLVPSFSDVNNGECFGSGGDEVEKSPHSIELSCLPSFSDVDNEEYVDPDRCEVGKSPVSLKLSNSYQSIDPNGDKLSLGNLHNTKQAIPLEGDDLVLRKFFDYKLILAPIHHPKSQPHWTLVVIEPLKNTIRHYDSMHSFYRYKTRCATMTKWMVKQNEEGRKLETMGSISVKCVQQIDATSCGLFVAAFIETVILDAKNGMAHNTELMDVDVEGLRRQIDGRGETEYDDGKDQIDKNTKNVGNETSGVIIHEEY
ncbi:hypothetical protein BELL_1228g00020 [Botrytis elliptica]|uniref:Ubiquitin-like protease family profile domain-containing protein n=1 Tax=Botrytis elliptica TaxID=278938 RepID=A0A4Z1IJS9_9HELO|nr:hypothetical protein BELL_1228g00020 [Botrytis elliptica]